MELDFFVCWQNDFPDIYKTAWLDSHEKRRFLVRT